MVEAYGKFLAEVYRQLWLVQQRGMLLTTSAPTESELVPSDKDNATDVDGDGETVEGSNEENRLSKNNTDVEGILDDNEGRENADEGESTKGASIYNKSPTSSCPARSPAVTNSVSSPALSPHLATPPTHSISLATDNLATLQLCHCILQHIQHLRHPTLLQILQDFRYL